MNIRWTLLVGLLLFAVAGCSSTSNAGQSSKELTSSPPDSAGITPESKITEEAAQGNPNIASIAPEDRIIEEATPDEEDSSLPVMTVNSPPIAVTQIQGNANPPSASKSLSTENWQTYTSSVFGIAVDYPPDWSVAEETDGAIFTSPIGTTILLNIVNANSDREETRLGNTRCTSRTNAHQLTAEVCVDSASFVYTAKFTLQVADGSTKWLSLTTKTRTTGDVFEVMFNSVRLTN